MIVLSGEFDDPKPLVRGGGEGAADGREDAGGAKATNRSRGAQGDVDGMRGLVRRAHPVGHAGTPGRGLVNYRAG